jgi:hypothetical protein
VNGSTVQNQPAPVEQVIRELRTIRGYALKCAGALDTAGKSEAVHSLRMALCSLDDCLSELEKPEPPTSVMQPITDRSLKGLSDELAEALRPDTIADDRRDDLMADADRSEYR